MNITTLNLNGLRSAQKKDFSGWIAQNTPEIMALQEVRAEAQPLFFEERGYHSYWHVAARAGYSGVAIASQQPALSVQYGLSLPEFDGEGRVLLAQFAQCSVISVYVPSGSSGETRQAFKMRFLEEFAAYVQNLLPQHPRLVIAGDFNVAHQNIDLANWRSNQKNSGFLPEERAWLSEFLKLGLVDTHRQLLGEQAEYTWWSNRANAYHNNVGWRLDYQFATPVLGLRQHTADRASRLSDHAPLSLQYALNTPE